MPNTTITNQGQDPYTISEDFEGSYQQWLNETATAMAQRYATGDQSMLDGLSGATGPVGQPLRTDFGKNTVSDQTVNFFKRYLQAYGSSDPYIGQNFGTPPGRSATFTQSPNSPSVLKGLDGKNAIDLGTLQGKNSIDLETLQGKNARDLQADTDAAAMARSQGQWDNNWKIASLQDATSRWKAEGDWGVQKYVAELGEKGALDRLMLQLGFDRERLALDAKTQRDNMDLEYKKLALEIAKYDAELAGQPQNIWKYAAWLQKRGQVVNGLNIAMASSIVPAESISAATVASSGIPGAAAIATTFMDETNQMSPTPEVQRYAAEALQRSGQPRVAQEGTGSMAPVSTTTTPMNNLSAQGLQQTTDYAALTNQLLNRNPLQADAPSVSDMQDITTDRTRELAGVSGGKGGFGSWQGPTTNALGVNVGDPSGQKVDYRAFYDAPWAQQQMKLADVGSVGKFQNDFLGEMQRARPKGNATGAASWG